MLLRYTVRLSLFAVLGLGLLAATGCARLRGGDPARALTLELALDAPAYAPGAPVVAQLTLTNTGGRAVEAVSLDRTALTFSFRPAQAAGPQSGLLLVEPVYSEKEPAGQGLRLKPGEAQTRRFVLTRLTLERGAYFVQAIYALPRPSGERPAPKVYARAVPFKVEGEKVFAHRYPDGLITRQEAIARAAAQAGFQPAKSDALLVTNQLGFREWWINLAPTGGGATKSFYVNPYTARVIGPAQRPFTAEDQGLRATPPKDSKAAQQVRERMREGKK